MSGLSDIWQSLKDEFRHAFSVPDESLTEEEEHLLKLVAKAVVERHLSAPAVFTLESFKPLNFVSSQAMVVLGPVIKPLVNPGLYRRIQKVLEKRPAMEKLAEYIEEFRDHPGKMERVEGSLSLWGGVEFESEEEGDLLFSRSRDDADGGEDDA